MLSEKEGKELLKLARESIKTFFEGRDVQVKDKIIKKYSEKHGVFVTININNELRGCIGYAEPIYPLLEGVLNAARSAAFSDPRFKPLTKDEFKDIELELSVLTVPELIKVDKPEDYIKKIKIGEDGLIIRSKYSSGLLLPQVAPGYNWDVRQFLEHTCEKAGLDKDSWKEKSILVYKFQAQIFKEG